MVFPVGIKKLFFASKIVGGAWVQYFGFASFFICFVSIVGTLNDGQTSIYPSIKICSIFFCHGFFFAKHLHRRGYVSFFWTVGW